MLAPGYNIDPFNSTPDQLQSFLTKSRGKHQKDLNRRQYYNSPAFDNLFGLSMLRHHPRPYDNLFNGKEGLFKDPTYGISKIPSVRPTEEGGQWTGGGYDYSNANWDPIRNRINTVGQIWNRNAASRTNSGLGLFLKPLGIAASFGLPLVGAGPASAFLSKFGNTATSIGRAAGIGFNSR